MYKKYLENIRSIEQTNTISSSENRNFSNNLNEKIAINSFSSSSAQASPKNIKGNFLLVPLASLESNSDEFCSHLDNQSIPPHLPPEKSDSTRMTSLINSQTKIRPKRLNTMSIIDINLLNEEGENESVEIDIADAELNSKEDENPLKNARRQSISDRISRRRTSELAAEILRLSAENRRKEFMELLDEHSEIVQSIDNWRIPEVSAKEPVISTNMADLQLEPISELPVKDSNQNILS